MDEALQRVDMKDSPLIKFCLPFQMAKFRYRWYDDREAETINLAEMFLERLGQQTAEIQDSFSREREWVTHKLRSYTLTGRFTVQERGRSRCLR